MTIVLTGGGTLGSVSPLLAVEPLLRAHGHHMVFIGTVGGPERRLVQEAGIAFHAIESAKLRRYVSVWHLFVPIQFVVGCVQALLILLRTKPQVIVSVGGFVSVPVVWMGWLLRIPAVIHQQDIVPGLANRLMMRCARVMTVAFEDSLKQFSGRTVEWIGNPVRDLTPTTQTLSLDASVPTVLVIGGGTGAHALNALVTPEWCEQLNVLHVTGSGRAVHTFTHRRYHAYEFVSEEMKELLAAADVVVSRAGLGFITELAALAKPSIIIPMPHSHQEANATMLKMHKAALVLSQEGLRSEQLLIAVLKVVENTALQQKLKDAIGSLMPQGATQRFADIIDTTARA